MSDMKQFEQFAEMMQSMMPKVQKSSKNGYEIRIKVLEFAQNQAWQDYHAKMGAFETSVTKEGDEIITKVEMPEVPGTESVLETANKFYEFISGNANKK